MSLTTETMEKIAECVIAGVEVGRGRDLKGVPGVIDWKREGVGYCACPGADLHNNPTGRRDCRVTVVPGRSSDAPTIYCFHTTCAEVVAAANHKLRSEIGKAKACGGGAPPGHRPGGSPPKTQGNATRTARTPFFNVTPAGTRSLGTTRTVRTSFSPSYTQGQQNDIRIDGAKEVSEASVVEVEREESPETPSEPSAPEGIDEGVSATWRGLAIERTREPLPAGCIWIGKDDKVFEAQRTDNTLVIGRRIKREGKQNP